MKLVRYEAACVALAECKSVDEVKDWTDKAAAMQAYGRMCKDKTLEVDAAEIRIRAERRLGQLLQEQKAGPGLAKSGPKPKKPKSAEFGHSQVPNSAPPPTPTLAEVGIDKNLSSRAQKLAAVSDEQFEAEVGEWKGRVKAEGARVSARLEAAGQAALDEKREALTILVEENARLNERLAVEAMDASEEEKTAAAALISELKAELKVVRAELQAVKVTRDTLLTENAELKRQCAWWRKQVPGQEKPAKKANGHDKAARA